MRRSGRPGAGSPGGQGGRRLRPARLASLAGTSAVLLFCLLPVWSMAAASLEPDPATSVSLVPRHPSVDNYRMLLSGTYRFGLALRNSLVVAGATTVIAIAVGAGAGYALARLRFRGKPIVLAALLALAMFPGIALVPALFQLFSELDWLDHYQAMVIPDSSFGLPLAAWLLASTLAELPWELEDAARVDGATRWVAFRRVVAPLAAPGVAAAALVVFVFAWNEFLFASAMTLTPAVRPVTVAIAQLPTVQGLGVTMAAGVLVTVPALVLVLVLQRRVAVSLAGARAATAVRTGAQRRTARQTARVAGQPGRAAGQPGGVAGRPARAPSRRSWRWAGQLLAAVLAVPVLALAVGSSGPPAPVPVVRADDGARIVTVDPLDRRTLDLTVASPALGRTAKVRLLLPRRFRAEPARRWPVLYLLHGCCDSYVSWTRSTDVEHLTATADLLVVMPEAGPVGFYSDWDNGGRGGPPRWETFHLVELRQLLERAYRAGDRRAVAGLSMGGLGAMAYAARHPGLFRAAASFSGILDTRPDGPAGGGAFVLDLLRSFGQDPRALWGDAAGRAAAWHAHDPYELAPRLRGTELFVAFGDGRPGPLDRPGADVARASTIERRIHAQNVAFVGRLRQLGIPARVDAYGAGTHDWPYWQRELHRAFPLLSRP